MEVSKTRVKGEENAKEAEEAPERSKDGAREPCQPPRSHHGQRRTKVGARDEADRECVRMGQERGPWHKRGTPRRSRWDCRRSKKRPCKKQEPADVHRCVGQTNANPTNAKPWRRAADPSKRETIRTQVSGIVATVFGGSGFLGRYVINNLGKVGSQVVYPFRCSELDIQHIRVMGDLGKMVPFRFDIRDEDAIAKAVSQSNVVINLIGTTRETWNFSFHDVHVKAAERIARIAKESGVQRLLHVSSSAASLDAPCESLRTKAEGEALVRERFPEATVFRPTLVTGPEDSYLNSYALMSKKSSIFPIVNKDQKLQPIYVVDAATAITNALYDEDTAGKTYELGGDHVYTKEQMLQFMFDTIRETPNYVVVPQKLMQFLATPVDALNRRIPVPSFLQVPFFTGDEVASTSADMVVSPGSLGCRELGVTPCDVTKGIPMERIRALRSGGYDIGQNAVAE